MTRARALTAAAAVAFLSTVFLANWLVNHYGPVRVWPTHLLAPAGVYAVGVAFLLRDTVQRFAGAALALGCVAAGAALSLLVSPSLALASAAAFALSELAGLVVFWAAGGNVGGPPRLSLAVVAASLVAAAVDSYVFLTIAFHSLGFFQGQFVAKVSVVALSFPFVLLARRRWPAAAAEPAIA